jgi:hypothetical protein
MRAEEIVAPGSVTDANFSHVDASASNPAIIRMSGLTMLYLYNLEGGTWNLELKISECITAPR